MAKSPFYFDTNYREDTVLADGTLVRLRLVRPSDKELIATGFKHLSPTSRYRRFLSAKTALSESELTYLTELDGTDHFALGAITTLSDGTEKGLGLARFVRQTVDPFIAEPAITVIDEAQGKGLGRLLLLRLMAAAVERGLRCFRSDVLVPNEPMRALLRELVPEASVEPYEDIMRVDVPLPYLPANHPTDEMPKQNPLYRLLTLAAKLSLYAKHLSKSARDSSEAYPKNSNTSLESDEDH
ncbi:MAG: GNAT family N-acetyltransferase [Acidobacteria bacterium]|nr:GNAT family N-acetyltransferase [Acidobacteriota bacterium]MBI3657651.1 GNAT family N-acetyltransferase [Acidobacteriota bacterium]